MHISRTAHIIQDKSSWIAQSTWIAQSRNAQAASDISRFFPRIDRIFPGEALNPFFGAQDEGFLEFRPR